MTGGLISSYSFTRLYSGDLNSKLLQYSDDGDLFACQMVHYSDAQYHHGSSVFGLPFGQRIGMQTTI